MCFLSVLFFRLPCAPCFKCVCVRFSCAQCFFYIFFSRAAEWRRSFLLFAYLLDTRPTSAVDEERYDDGGNRSSRGGKGRMSRRAATPSLSFLICLVPVPLPVAPWRLLTFPTKIMKLFPILLLLLSQFIVNAVLLLLSLLLLLFCFRLITAQTFNTRGS